MLFRSSQPPVTVSWPASAAMATSKLATMVTSALAQAGLAGAFSSITGDSSGLHLIGVRGENPPGGLQTADFNGTSDLTIVSTRQQANPSTDYFTGPSGASVPIRSFGQGGSLGAGVAANNPAIEELVKGLRLAANVQTSPTLDTASLKQAYAIIKQAITDIGTVQGQVGLLENEATSAASWLGSSVTSLQSNQQDLTGADLASLMTQINQQETQLQAAFMIISRLSSLTVLNELH